MMGPREREAALLRFIVGYQAAKGGISPNYDECARAIGNRSKSRAAAVLDRLEQRGAIRRLPYRARAIEVLQPVPVPTIDGAPLYAVPMIGLAQERFAWERL